MACNFPTADLSHLAEQTEGFLLDGAELSRPSPSAHFSEFTA
jgi:hypothetical protein